MQSGHGGAVVGVVIVVSGDVVGVVRPGDVVSDDVTNDEASAKPCWENAVSGAATCEKASVPVPTSDGVTSGARIAELCRSDPTSVVNSDSAVWIACALTCSWPASPPGLGPEGF